MIVQITDKEEKRAVSRKILEALKDWFEVDESSDPPSLHFIAFLHTRSCHGP